jgi:UDP-N-acetylmuramoyl-L-alanyl-D-glutamate--2,6-diaminopimelate ligase
MSSPGERLDRLAAEVGGRLIGGGDLAVVDVTHDSREAGPGVLFVAVRGMTADGHRFAPAAVEAGSPALVVDHQLDLAVPQIVVADTRGTLGALAAAVHGHPSDRLALIGVTGTNGKTSVCSMVEAMATAAGMTVGVIGTLGARVAGETIPLERTTPEATDFQRILALMGDRGATVVVAEVSSHALALGRVDRARFAVAAFTNLSQDHLDFHGDMERYFAAKAGLFEPGRSRRAVIWVDDPHGSLLVRSVEIPAMTVATRRPADLSGTVVSADLAGSEVDLTLPAGESIRLRVPIAGGFSVANALVAAGCALEIGVAPSELAAGLAGLAPSPGRFEVVSGNDPVGVVVDYSHTPAGIEAAIATARPLAQGRVIALVGAGGDRDRAKRPAMGAAASAADLVVVTSDNPRSEDPAAIMADIVKGVTTTHELIVDRRLAIRRALTLAGPGDIVLVMGKGHEAYQEIGGRRLPFDDRTVAAEELAVVRESRA